MSETVTTTIYFNDGSVKKFTTQRPEGDDYNRGSLQEKTLNSNSFVLEVDGDMMIIPVSSIKYITVSPKPPTMPPVTIRNYSEIK